MMGDRLIGKHRNIPWSNGCVAIHCGHMFRRSSICTFAIDTGRSASNADEENRFNALKAVFSQLMADAR